MEVKYFDKEKFSTLLEKAKGQRGINEYGRDAGVSGAHISRLIRCLLDSPPSPQTIKKLADTAHNEVSYVDLMAAAGYFESMTSPSLKNEEGLKSLIETLLKPLQVSQSEISALANTIWAMNLPPEKLFSEVYRALLFKYGPSILSEYDPILNQGLHTEKNRSLPGAKLKYQRRKYPDELEEDIAFYPDFEIDQKEKDHQETPEQAIFELNEALADGAQSEKIHFKRSAPNRVGIPILGTIHDTTELLSEENIEDRIVFESAFNGSYILIVEDDSMEQAGLRTNDAVICKADDEADSGEIVVSFIGLDSKSPKVLLRMYIENDDKALFRAANPHYPDIITNTYNRIVGVPIAVLRRIEDLPPGALPRNSLSDDWAKVIQFATSAGLSPTNVKHILESQIELSKKIQERMPELFKQGPSRDK